MPKGVDLSVYQSAWQQSDWSRFSELLDLKPANLDKKPSLALMLTGAALYVKPKDFANQLIAKALSLTDSTSVKRFAFAIYQVQLGRAFMLSGQQPKALLHFQSGYAHGGELTQPLFYDFICQEAEQQLSQGDARAAIQTWQDLASILQKDTPEHVYHRMSHCYSVNQQGFGGEHQENEVWGDCHKHDLLEFIHTHLQPQFYFEIGVDEGLSLARAKGQALGVDARPKLKLAVDLPKKAEILGISSDAFFRDKAVQSFSTPPDLAFIDGMHLFEFALRDFMNLECHAAPYALVGIDDIYPCHPTQAERRRRSGAWTGDVWKLLPILQKYRPDLTLIPLPCSTTGMLLIAGLDAQNRQLNDHYADIIREFQANLPVPEFILQRSDSLPSDHPVVSLLLSVLKRARENQLDAAQVSVQLAQLVPFIDEAKHHKDLLLHPKTLKQLNHEQELTDAQMYQTQLFLPQAQNPVYSQKATLKLNLPSTGWQEAVFSFCHALVNFPLRFDPSTRPGLFEINLVRLVDKNANQVLLELTDKEHLQKITAQGDCLLLNHPEKFVFYAYASDSILMLPVIETLETDLELCIRIRLVSDEDEIRECWELHFDRR